MPESAKPALLALWLALLGATLACAAGRAISEASTRPEFASGCDSFGYLSMSRALRKGWAEGHWPRFELESTQADSLARDFSQSSLPFESWDHLVSPHAYHYVKTSGKNVPQYPPGTAILTAPFPEGTAIFDLTTIDVLVALGAGLAALMLAWRRRSWVSAGWATLVAIFAIRLPEAARGRSFSIEALIVPCGFGAALAAVAWALEVREGRRGHVLWTAFAAGALLGFSILCRLPCAFMIPGVAAPLLLLGRRGFAPVAVLGMGVLAFGFLPLFVHQAVLTGHFYLPTYAMSVVSPSPSLASFRSGFSYYLGRGEGAGFNWAIATLLIAVPAGMGLGAFNRRKLARLGTGAFLAWAIPTSYFLPYQIQEPYYLAAGTLAALAFFAAGACMIERSAPKALDRGATRTPNLRKGPAVAALACLASWPAVSLAPSAFREATFPGRARAAQIQVSVPAELRDPKSWVWADYYSGTITYYGGHAALRLSFSTPESRASAVRVARELGGDQYIVDDGGEMPRLMEELKLGGAELEPRGKIDSFRYYRIRWPVSTRRPFLQRAH